jgi:hypothetical protein
MAFCVYHQIATVFYLPFVPETFLWAQPLPLVQLQQTTHQILGRPADGIPGGVVELVGWVNRKFIIVGYLFAYRKLGRLDLAENVGRPSHKRQSAREEYEEDDAHRPHVRRFAVATAGRHLGCHELGDADSAYKFKNNIYIFICTTVTSGTASMFGWKTAGQAKAAHLQRSVVLFAANGKEDWNWMLNIGRQNIIE